MSILIVDDNADTLESCRELFEMDGHTVFTATNIEQAKEHCEKHAPSLIVVDEDPAGMSAVSIIADLKNVAMQHRVPVPTGIALRGDFLQTDRPVLVGFEHVLCKPVNFDWLESLASVYSKRDGQQLPGTSTVTHRQP